MSVILELRPARRSEAEIMARMSRDFIETGLGWQWRSQRILHHIRCTDSVVLAARNPAQLVGFAIMHFGLDEAHLLLLAVETAFRRRGVGRQLVEWLEKSARTAGIATIYLEVRANNPAAQDFYRALDYHDLYLVPDYYQGRESALRMAHDLRVKPPASPLW
ncbi:MAG: GNAT family N-acetyltransferase [Candidatus Competibacteraceae bacterium]|jgi:ribosomal-protein-alanine N-acetyltransferase|nr:GNAT family N-acetyltransferase [Candidatus Competibacteraceae bacterium]